MKKNGALSRQVQAFKINPQKDFLLFADVNALVAIGRLMVHCFGKIKKKLDCKPIAIGEVVDEVSNK